MLVYYCHNLSLVTVGGSTMTLTVTVTLDGKTYRGCGRSLPPPLP